MKKNLLTIVCLSLTLSLFAQDTIRNKKNGGYLFKKMAELETNSVQDQNRTSTC